MIDADIKSNRFIVFNFIVSYNSRFVPATDD